MVDIKIMMPTTEKISRSTSCLSAIINPVKIPKTNIVYTNKPVFLETGIPILDRFDCSLLLNI